MRPHFSTFKRNTNTILFVYILLAETVVQLVRAPPCQGGSHGFESRQSRLNLAITSKTSLSFNFRGSLPGQIMPPRNGRT